MKETLAAFLEHFDLTAEIFALHIRQSSQEQVLGTAYAVLVQWRDKSEITVGPQF